jgi:hypothetical protein
MIHDGPETSLSRRLTGRTGRATARWVDHDHTQSVDADGRCDTGTVLLDWSISMAGREEVTH